MSQNKRIDIRVASKQKNVEIFSDPDIVKTIIRNLLSNAMKFSYSNSEVIFDIEEKEDCVIISVEDFGCGIPECNKVSILGDKEMGYTSYGTDNEEGSGLGLSLCNEFTKKLGGHIWFESEENKGSKFYVCLPKVYKAKSEIQ